MVRFFLESAKIVGTATDKAWSQVHLFSSTDKEKQALRGELVAVLSLGGLEEGIEAVAAGREIISRLHEEYYGNLEGKAFEKLTSAVSKVCQEAAPEAQIEIGAAAIVGEVIYLAVSGQGQVILQRNTQLGQIIQGQDGLKTASGYLQKDDLFLLGSADFFRKVAIGVLKAALASGSPEEASEIIAPIIHGQTESALVTAIIFKIKAFPDENVNSKELPVTFSPLVNDKTEKEIGKLPRAKLIINRPRMSESLKKISLALFKSKLNQIFISFKKRLEKRAIYLKQERQKETSQIGQTKFPVGPRKSQKMLFTVVLILLILLGLSVFLGNRQRKKITTEKSVAATFEEAKQKKEEGEALIDLNPARARELFLEAQNLSQKIDEKGWQDDQYRRFKEELAQVLAKVVKERSVEARMVYDLELIKQDAQGDDLAFSGGKIFILDKEKNSVYEVDPESKSSAILAGSQNLGRSLKITAYLPKIFVLTETGIIEIDRITKKDRLVINSQDNWDKAIDLGIFGGSLYLLLGDNQLLQFPAQENGFGSPRNWLKEEKINFDRAVCLAIDGSIWILNQDGTILKFNRGKKEAFGLAGLDKPLSQPTKLYTDESSENFYLFDQGNSRVVIISKSGEYQAAYLINEPKVVNDLVVSEEKNKIYLLSGSKIYEIEIK